MLGVRSALSKRHVLEGLDPGWVQLVKFHHGALALAEYAGAVAELRMARFGRDSAWRMMANLGALDEIRHTQIPLLLGHDMLSFDGNFDWTHKAYHTNEWVMIAARHLFDDMFLAADAIDVAIQLNFVFETGFSNLQFMAMAAMADAADHHLFEKALASIQTDEARHAQIGHPVLRTLLENGAAERAQYLVDKMWWRCWRLMLALTGTAMEYLTPLDARTQSFKEFMEEWVVDQFMKNLAEFQLERPWFWDLFVEEMEYAHHSLQLGLYAYRTTLWFDVAMPDAREREWLSDKYPGWNDTFGLHWDRLEHRWATGGEAGTLASALPALCNLCQLPTLFVRPGGPAPRDLRVGPAAPGSVVGHHGVLARPQPRPHLVADVQDGAVRHGGAHARPARQAQDVAPGRSLELAGDDRRRRPAAAVHTVDGDVVRADDDQRSVGDHGIAGERPELRVPAVDGEERGVAHEPGDEAVGRTVVHVVGAAVLLDPPSPHDGHAIADRQRLGLVVGHEQRRRARWRAGCRRCRRAAGSAGWGRGWRTARRAARAAARAPAPGPGRRAGARRRTARAGSGRRARRARSRRASGRTARRGRTAASRAART